MADEKLGKALQRSTADLKKKSRAAVNIEMPPGWANPSFAPTPIKRMFGSPLPRSGKYVAPGTDLRIVFSGVGRPRTYHVNGQVKVAGHFGLDFKADIGDPVYAAADGTVTFVGVQRNSGGRLDDAGVHQDHTRTPPMIVSGDGQDLFSSWDVNKIGAGGIYVAVRHKGDFEGYATEYMHLDRAVVKVGEKVSEGTSLLGYVGNSAVRATPWHLHFQVRYQGKAINPTMLVPHRWAGHEDSTTLQAQSGLIDPGDKSPSSVASVRQAVAGTVQTVARSDTMGAQTRGTIKEAQASYYEMCARLIGANQTQLYEAVLRSQGQPPQIQTAMAFNFSTGDWEILS